MCIIVAKSAGVKMPADNLLSNCFTNNPDGAGIMVSAKGKVYGFKGLMTYDAFTAKLHQIEKRFGDLDKLNVVMHFRIKTHGTVIAANTHPFPVTSSYKAMRKLEWVADLGMAHNGIIDATCHHPDVKKENVSDTMVFIKRIVAPVVEQTSIMKNDKLLEALRLSADSKLAFMDGKRLVVLGDFKYIDGIYYSNSSYEAVKYTNWLPYAWDDDDAWDAYIDEKYVKKSSWNKDEDRPSLDQASMDYLMEETAVDYGLTIFPLGFSIICKDYEITPKFLRYATDGVGLYYWDTEVFDWYESSYKDDLVGYRVEGVAVDA